MYTKELHEEMVSLRTTQTLVFQHWYFFNQALGDSCPPDAAAMQNVLTLF